MDVPFEIIVTILMLLPAEDLIRFMLVCREWRDLIKDASFILKHLQVSASRGNNYLLCGSRDYPPLQYPFKLLSDKSHVKILEKEIRFPSPTGICHPIYSSEGLLLSCDGPSKAAVTTLYLYNPFIQKSKSIENSSLNLLQGGKFWVQCNIIGFGNHSQANGYKIVRLADIIYLGLDHTLHSLLLEVYSLRSDSWKRVEVGCFPNIHTNSISNFHIQKNWNAQVLVHDCFHWLAVEDIGDESRLMSFNLGKEAFQAIKLPNYEIDDYDFDKIVSYKDKLSLIVIHHDGLKRCCSLWALTEYGVFDSWSRFFVVAIDARIEKPFIFTRRDELIFREDNFLVVHNLFTQKKQYFDVSDIDPSVLFQYLPLTNSLTLNDCK